ncbi:MAG: efflux RND transporter periplasmic adaptor subunit [Lentisphaerota bacterium]
MQFSKKVSTSIFTVIAVIFFVLIIHSAFKSDTMIYTPLAKAGGINIAIPSTSEGTIAEIYIRSYQKVIKGQLMFKIDARGALIGIEASQLKIDLLRKKLESKKHAIEYDNKKFETVNDRIESERLEFENVKKQVEFYASVSNKDELQYLDLQNKEIVTSQKLLLSKSELMAYKASQLQTMEEKEIAEFDLEIALKELEFSKTMLAETEIRSPADGYAETIDVNKGQYVTNGFLITRLDVVIDGHTPVTALFTEDQVKTVSPDHEVFVRFNADPKKVYQGKIIDVAKTTLNINNTIVQEWDVSLSQIRQAKKYIEVYIDIPQNVFLNGAPVVEGMSASVAINDK